MARKSQKPLLFSTFHKIKTPDILGNQTKKEMLSLTDIVTQKEQTEKDNSVLLDEESRVLISGEGGGRERDTHRHYVRYLEEQLTAQRWHSAI